MPYFGKRSTDNLNTAHPEMQRLFNEVIKHYDCSIVCGHRERIKQDKYFDEGRSQKRWPDGEHNKFPSNAVDAVPYINGRQCWDKEQLYFFAAFVWGTAIQLGIKIRLGADWDGDGNIKDQRFIDRPHFELID
jgi:peptidoglycan L-alanyl-D-glutamate endopeptidase CwlK